MMNSEEDYLPAEGHRVKIRQTKGARTRARRRRSSKITNSQKSFTNEDVKAINEEFLRSEKLASFQYSLKETKNSLEEITQNSVDVTDDYGKAGYVQQMRLKFELLTTNVQDFNSNSKIHNKRLKYGVNVLPSGSLSSSIDKKEPEKIEDKKQPEKLKKKQPEKLEIKEPSILELEKYSNILSSPLLYSKDILQSMYQESLRKKQEEENRINQQQLPHSILSLNYDNEEEEKLLCKNLIETQQRTSYSQSPIPSDEDEFEEISDSDEETFERNQNYINVASVTGCEYDEEDHMINENNSGQRQSSSMSTGERYTLSSENEGENAEKEVIEINDLNSNSDELKGTDSYGADLEDDVKIFESKVQLTLAEPKRRRSLVETRNPHILLKVNSYQPSTLFNIKRIKEFSSSTSDLSEFEDNKQSCKEIPQSLKNISIDEDDDIPPEIRELILTEENYVRVLKFGIENYGSIFDNKQLKRGLRGKKWIVLGNIEAITEFHEEEFLPMLKRNCRNLKRLFELFLKFIEDDSFYSYVLYSTNKSASLDVYEQHQEYFKEIQGEINDKLGINSFLMQPIQRLGRYPLLLQQFITKCFKSGDIQYKPIIEICCKVEKKLRDILRIADECQVINKIEECYDINLHYQGRFKKVDEFEIYDYTLRRSYPSKVFMFEKSLVYTEIKDSNRLTYRGCYPSENIGFIAKQKNFSLYYQKRKIQECDFSAKQSVIDTWIELIRNMLTAYAMQEKQKLLKKYTKINEIYRRPGSVVLIRNSSRLSADSGIESLCRPGSPMSQLVGTSGGGSIMTTLPNTPTLERNSAGSRTTWYTDTPIK